MPDITTDPNDPRLVRGRIDDKATPQAEAYLVLPQLPEEYRERGWTEPLRFSYSHVGAPTPTGELRDLTEEEKVKYKEFGYVKYEAYPPERLPISGRYWTHAQLTAQGCHGVTRLSQAIAETYARDPKFYGATYCAGCEKHRPVNEFIWTEDNVRVGQSVRHRENS